MIHRCLVVALAVTIFSCSPRSQNGSWDAPTGEAVAFLSGEAISPLDLHLPPDASDAARRRALDQAIYRRLVDAEARRRGLAERPEMAGELAATAREAKAREEALLRDALFASVREGLEISDDALRAHYSATKIRYAERQVRLIRQPYASRDAAEQALAKSESGPGGGEVVGPAPLAKLPPTVLPEAASLTRLGARVVAGSEEEGWSVIELAEVLPAEPRPFEEVRGEVEQSLRAVEGEKALRRLLEELRAKAAIEIDEAALARAAPVERAGRGGSR